MPAYLMLKLWSGTDKSSTPIHENYGMEPSVAGERVADYSRHAGIDYELDAGSYTIEVGSLTVGNTTGTPPAGYRGQPATIKGVAAPQHWSTHSRACNASGTAFQAGKGELCEQYRRFEFPPSDEAYRLFIEQTSSEREAGVADAFRRLHGEPFTLPTSSVH